MFVIWSGWGFLTVLFAVIGIFVGVFTSSFLGEAVSLAVATIIAAGLNFLMARKLRAKRRELVDPKTGEPVVLTDGSSLFFIPMRFWTYIIVVLGVLLVIIALRGPTGA